MTHTCVGKLTIIASDNGLSPGRRQAIIWTNAGILLIGPLGTKFNKMLIKIHTFSFKKMHLKMSSAKWRSFCLGPNVLMLFLILPQTISDEVGNKVKLYSLFFLFLFFRDEVFQDNKDPQTDVNKDAQMQNGGLMSSGRSWFSRLWLHGSGKWGGVGGGLGWGWCGVGVLVGVGGWKCWWGWGCWWGGGGGCGSLNHSGCNFFKPSSFENNCTVTIVF